MKDYLKKDLRLNYKSLGASIRTLQTIAVQSLYYSLRLKLKKQPRNENIMNFIEVVLGFKHNMRLKRSVFGGKIGFFGKKLCLNLT